MPLSFPLSLSLSVSVSGTLKGLPFRNLSVSLCARTSVAAHRSPQALPLLGRLRLVALRVQCLRTGALGARGGTAAHRGDDRRSRRGEDARCAFTVYLYHCAFVHSNISLGGNARRILLCPFGLEMFSSEVLLETRLGRMVLARTKRQRDRHAASLSRMRTTLSNISLSGPSCTM